MTKFGLLLLIAITLALIGSGAKATVSIYVDGTNGLDTNNGSIGSPYKTLTKAQTAVRSLGLSQPITVYIRQGTYSFPTSPWSFTSIDSGSASSPIVWTSYPNEDVSIVAGVEIPSSSWTVAASPASAYVLDLAAANLAGYIGSLPGANGLGSCSAIKGMELFFDGVPMTRARYPNIFSNGTWQWAFAGPVTSTSFKYSESQPSNWVGDVANMKLHGFWRYDWADSWVAVKSINISDSTINIDPATPPVYPLAQGFRWLAVNVFAELDAPGEYYINNATKEIYFIPPSPITSGKTFVSTSANVLRISSLQNVKFQGLKFFYAQQAGVVLTGVCVKVDFVGCTFANHGGYGLTISNIVNSTLTGNSFYQTGCGGVSFNAGNTTSLTRGNYQVTQNQFRDYARIIRTYTPAISYAGVGNYIALNSLTNGPHSGILGSGNYFLIENNTFDNLVYGATDSGAFYTGRKWTNWYNVFRYNRISNIRLKEARGAGTIPEVNAIYLDDQMSGWEVYGNSLINTQGGLVIGGGRNNSVFNNYFQDSDRAIYIDNRGMTWQTGFCQANGTFQQDLQAVNYQQPPWSLAFPWLPNIMQDRPCVPVYNKIFSNTYCNLGSRGFINHNQTTLASWNSTLSNNTPLCSTLSASVFTRNRRKRRRIRRNPIN